MQLIFSGNLLCLRVLAATLLCGFGITVAVAQVSYAGRKIELTKEDTFSIPQWERGGIAVDGFQLGMTRAQAFANARTQNLTLRSKLPPRTVAEAKKSCDSDSCAVSRIGGPWIGLDLFFREDRIVRIGVSVPTDADLEVKAANISRRFHGLTFRFFNDYSEALRHKLFGSGKRTESLIPNGTESNLVQITNEYPKLGLVIRSTIDRQDQAARPFDLEVDYTFARQEP